MQTGTRIGLAVGFGAGAIVAGGLVAVLAQSRRQEPNHELGTSPGDEPIAMPVRGLIDPPGWWNDYTVDGHLERDRLDATIDPRGWMNDVRLNGRVDYAGFDTRIDPRGWGNDTVVRGARTANGFDATVDRPGIWNDVRLRITETVRGAEVIREGRFDETLVPSFNEATWRSTPVGFGGGARVLEFDPPGWSNTTRVDLEGNVPAGVESTIASYLFDQWKLEQERRNDYPDPSYPDPTAPGDDDDYPTALGDS